MTILSPTSPGIGFATIPSESSSPHSGCYSPDISRRVIELENFYHEIEALYSEDATGCSSLVTASRFKTKNIDDITSSPSTKIVSVAEKIGMIRASLSLQIKELAAILRVERPTVYAWIQNNSAPQKQNQRRIDEIYSIAQEWNQLSSLPMGDWVRQAPIEGLSLVESLVHDELDPVRLQRLLKAVADRVMTEQETLGSARRFAQSRGFSINHENQADVLDIMTRKRMSMDE